MQIDHILVPTDFSPHAERATELAVTFAQKFGAELTLLHVARTPEYAYAQHTAQSLDDLLPKARDALDRAVARVKPRVPNVTGVLEQGVPWEAILSFAQHQGVGLIVMGTHGRRGIPRALLGSVTEKVVRTSPVPMLTVSLKPYDADTAAS